MRIRMVELHIDAALMYGREDPKDPAGDEFHFHQINGEQLTRRALEQFKQTVSDVGCNIRIRQMFPVKANDSQLACLVQMEERQTVDVLTVHAWPRDIRISFPFGVSRFDNRDSASERWRTLRPCGRTRNESVVAVVRSGVVRMSPSIHPTIIESHDSLTTSVLARLSCHVWLVFDHSINRQPNRPKVADGKNAIVL